MLSRAALSTEPCEFLQVVVGPIMTEIGDRWKRGDLRIVHEHACSTVMRGLLFSLMRLYPANDAMRRVVVGTPAKEDHELGALMVAMLAAMHGWSVLYLGPDLPAEEIAYAVTDTKAELLMLSDHQSNAQGVPTRGCRDRGADPQTREDPRRRASREVPTESRAQIQQDLALVRAELSR